MSIQSISPDGQQHRTIAKQRIGMLLGLLLRLLARVVGWIFAVFAACGMLSAVLCGGMNMFGHGLGQGKGPLIYVGETRFDCTTWQGVALMVLLNLLLMGLGRGFIKLANVTTKNSPQAR